MSRLPRGHHPASETWDASPGHRYISRTGLSLTGPGTCPLARELGTYSS